MNKDEQIRQRQANFRQTNAYAMQNGVILGLWSIVCQACFVISLSQPIVSNIYILMLLGIPVVTWFLTWRFRRIVGLDVSFPFSRGFMHAFLTLLYAAVWAAIAAFVYMYFFDKGYVFDCFVNNISQPETMKALKESGLWQQITEAYDGQTPIDIINALRSFGAANWAAAIIYTYMLVSPIISIFIGLFTMRRVHYHAK